MSEITKVVHIDEFRARLEQTREPNHAAGADQPRVLQWGSAGGDRTLTPHQISHRFAMLAFLRKAR